MADARKRARRGASPAPEPAQQPAQEPAPESAPDTSAIEPVFADEPVGTGEAVPAAAPGSGIVLPASGLAEDILARLGGAPRAAAESVTATAADAALPVSGRAEEVLGREQTLSFFSAPAQAQRAAAEATEHLATFFLAKEEYGVDVKQVQEIRRVAEITSVPRAPEFVRGVINLRGRILPVLDLRRRLALGEVVVGGASRIVVVRVKERLLGLLVDGASQVLKIPVSNVEPAPEEVVQKGGDYIRGVAKLADRLIILVDLERLLASELAATGAAATGLRAAEAQDGASQE
jgi:purine-binding chemotaxis protein CheW